MKRKEDKWSDILRGSTDRDFLGHLKLIRSPQEDKNYESIEATVLQYDSNRLSESCFGSCLFVFAEIRQVCKSKKNLCD